MSEDTPGRKVKVVDRRPFTPDGELRDSEGASPAPAGAGAAPGPQAAEPAADRATPGEEAPERPGRGDGSSQEAAAAAHRPTAPLRPPEFFDLVELLVEPAAALLTGTVPGYPKDITAARRFIDLLAVLRAKTQGNLTPDEDHLLDDALYQLHRLFVAAGR